MGATRELIANAVHCPIAFFTTQTNLANLSASKSRHIDQAVSPRLERRDEKPNAQLVLLYDPGGRLFLASEDPAPVDQNLSVVQQQADLKIRPGVGERGAQRARPAIGAVGRRAVAAAELGRDRRAPFGHRRHDQ